MGDYNRSTKEIAFGELPANVTKSIQTYIEKHNLGDILASPMMCIVSTSEKIKKGLFGGGPGPKLLIQTAILTDRWLILADNVDQNALKPTASKPWATAARRKAGCWRHKATMEASTTRQALPKATS